MTDKEMIEMLVKQLESVGSTCHMMVPYLTAPWEGRMKKSHEDCKEAADKAKEHLDKKETIK